MAGNVFIAVALTSLLINLFFLIGVVLYASTSWFDESMHKSAVARYCDDYRDIDFSDNKTIKVDGKQITPKDMFNVTCKSGDFAPYYDQAVESYIKDLAE